MALVDPAVEDAAVARCYQPETLVMETTFRGTADSACVIGPLAVERVRTDRSD